MDAKQTSKLVWWLADILLRLEALFHEIGLWLGKDWTEEEANGGLNFFERILGDDFADHMFDK